MKILNHSFDNATSILTVKYQKVVQENMMQFLREKNMVSSNFDRADELSALLVKKSIFPYKDINDRDLDQAYETCPRIERFADNVLKKIKNGRRRNSKTNTGL